MSLNQRETEALDGFTKALRPVFELESCHPSDVAEITQHVHAIQNVILARSAVRADLDHLTHLRGFCGHLTQMNPFESLREVCTETDHAARKAGG